MYAAMLTGFFSNCKYLTPKIYNHIVSHLELHRVRCSCGHAGCLIRHGYYSRKLKLRYGTYSFRILRVKCRECGHTHAILPDSVVPYSQIPVDIQHKLLLYPLGSNELNEIMDNNSDITESDVLHIRARFRRYWKARLDAAFAELNSSLQSILDRCYSSYSRQFMQIKRGVYLRI